MNAPLSARQSTHPAIVLGFWSSLAGAILSLAYMGGAMVSEAVAGFVLPPPEATQIIASAVTLFWAPTLLVMLVCVHYQAPPERQVFSQLAVLFMLGLTVLTCINRYTHLSVVRVAVEGGRSQDVIRFLPYDSGSVMLAVESLGWGLFAGLALLFAAAVFSGDGLARALRWVLVATGLACLVYAVAFAAGSAWLGYIGPLAWAAGFPAVTFLLLAFFFRALPAHGGARRLSPRSA